jgi:hypothetical protein
VSFRLWYQFDCTEAAVNRMIHKSLGTIFKNKCKNQSLEGLSKVFRLVSLIGLFEPMRVNNKERSEAFNQGPQGIEE